MDGEKAADGRYRPGGGQPAAVLAIQEQGGGGMVLLDLGDDQAIFQHNLLAWLEHRGMDPGAFPRRALVISHGHTIAPRGAPPHFQWHDGFTAAWKKLGPLRVMGPNLADLAREDRINPAWSAAEKRFGAPRSLKPGLEPLQWADGTRSRRVFLLTYPFSPPESGVPFQPLETMVVVAARPGYLVYSVCSHMALDAGRHPPLHAAELVRKYMDQGRLKPGPVHTLVTGTCGMSRSFDHRSESAEAAFDRTTFQQQLTTLKQDLGLRRVYFIHCAHGGLPEMHQAFQNLFKAAARHAFPGTRILLSPGDDAQQLPGGS